MKYLKIFYQYDNPERVLKIGHFTSQKLTGMGTAATNHFVFFQHTISNGARLVWASEWVERDSVVWREPSTKNRYKMPVASLSAWIAFLAITSQAQNAQRLSWPLTGMHG